MSINHRHEAIADYMIACPSMTKGEIASALGYTGPWLSTLINSDAFQMYLAERRCEYENDLSLGAVHRLHELDKAATKIIQSELEKADADPGFALNVKKTVQQNMGGKAAGAVHVDRMQVVAAQNMQINQTVLEKARDKMKRISQIHSDDDDLIGSVLGG